MQKDFIKAKSSIQALFIKNRIIVNDIFGILLSVVIALVVGCVLILLSTENPEAAIESLLLKPISNTFYVGSIINKAIPLIILGLSASVTFQTGFFNMGGEGQLYVGAFVGALIIIYVTGIPIWLHMVIAIIGAVVAGALYSSIAAIMKAYFNAGEIVVTLMLNYIALLVLSGFVNSTFLGPLTGGASRMAYFPDNLQIGTISQSSPAHYGFFIALFMVVIVYLLLYKTKLGYQMRLVGKNKRFAEYGGISIKKTTLLSFVISGGIAGLTGIVELLGVHHTYFDHFAVGLGADGLIIALLAKYNPVGVVLASFFYAYIKVGAQIMQQNTDASRELVVIIQALLVMLISSQLLIRYFAKRKIKVEEKANA